MQTKGALTLRDRRGLCGGLVLGVRNNPQEKKKRVGSEKSQQSQGQLSGFWGGFVDGKTQAK